MVFFFKFRDLIPRAEQHQTLPDSGDNAWEHPEMWDTTLQTRLKEYVAQHGTGGLTYEWLRLRAEFSTFSTFKQRMLCFFFINFIGIWKLATWAGLWTFPSLSLRSLPFMERRYSKMFWKLERRAMRYEALRKIPTPKIRRLLGAYCQSRLLRLVTVPVTLPLWAYLSWHFTLDYFIPRFYPAGLR
eukprot:TRINITY_DN46079_c0_g1_i1.p1 TRINITY_DN46079_c0_g1~~TRINITY_DN46079_c0_g1_i1.p1  ORF type:complete len:186 (+),score=2.82 TRINITY_DN46079_c0_g1_i1:17-574(+)